MAISAATQAAVAARAGHRCEYCRCPVEYSTNPYSIEHIEPRSRAGSDSPDNLALACQGCNNHKYTRTTATDPDTGAPAPLFHPRRHVFREHFVWSEDGAELIGLTPTGRATIRAVCLNRPWVINFRRLLMIAGLHPPSES